MARIGTKKPMSITTRRPVAAMLDGVSKAALIDLYTLALARAGGECDTAPSPQEVAKDAIPLLVMRGDRVPSLMQRFGGK